MAPGTKPATLYHKPPRRRIGTTATTCPPGGPWRKFYREGRARSVGVSNFQPNHLRRLHAECEIPPAVDQIEVNPYLTQDELRGFCAEHQIAVEAWSPSSTGNDRQSSANQKSHIHESASRSTDAPFRRRVRPHQAARCRVTPILPHQPRPYRTGGTKVIALRTSES